MPQAQRSTAGRQLSTIRISILRLKHIPVETFRDVIDAINDKNLNSEIETSTLKCLRTAI